MQPFHPSAPFCIAPAAKQCYSFPAVTGDSTTPYHARYFAHELTLQRPSADVDRLSASLFNATVDLNPHQIDAALFALKSPLSKGVLLADEVGLGKTIEAGLVLCQLWAERRRRLLVICPASIRKQWSLELEEKFNLPTTILDAPAYRKAQRAGKDSGSCSEQGHHHDARQLGCSAPQPARRHGPCWHCQGPRRHLACLSLRRP